MLQLCCAADEVWIWDLLELVPNPDQAHEVSEKQVGQVLKVMSRTDLASHSPGQGPRGLDVLTSTGGAGGPGCPGSGSGPL